MHFLQFSSLTNHMDKDCSMVYAQIVQWAEALGFHLCAGTNTYNIRTSIMKVKMHCLTKSKTHAGRANSGCKTQQRCRNTPRNYDDFFPVESFMNLSIFAALDCI